MQQWVKCVQGSIGDIMTTCWFCSSKMIWGGDHTREDHGMAGGGIVANLSCSNTKCRATALFITPEEEDY